MQRDATQEELELTIAAGVHIESCFKDGAFKLAANVTMGEDEGEEVLGWWLIFPIDVFRSCT